MAMDPNPLTTLTLRLIMQGKEVGSIIGKKGEIVKKFREDSGARINISDGSSPERIVTISGTTTSIIKAFELISRKLEEVYNQPLTKTDPSLPTPPITLRLIVPASQCGSLIGKGGSKIREIREVTGASIQVASEMLPNSTERAVTISGMSDAITKCIHHICGIMLESHPKGGTIPYRPRPHSHGSPGGLGGSGGPMIGPPGPGAHGPYGPGAPWNPISPTEGLGKLGGSPLAGLAALGLGGIGTGPNGPMNPAAPLAALAALAGSQLRSANSHPSRGGLGQSHAQSPSMSSASGGPASVQQEMTVPNELIGCVIGKCGTKIAEIRSITGAMIRISNSDELREGCTDRIITMTGNPDAVALAQYLINMSVELQKANLEDGAPSKPDTSNPTGSPSTSPGSSAPIPPLAKLLSNPLLTQLSSLGTLAGGLSELLSAAAAVASSSSPTSIPTHHRRHGSNTNGSGSGSAPYLPRIKGSSGTGSTKKSEGSGSRKFAPY